MEGDKFSLIDDIKFVSNMETPYWRKMRWRLHKHNFFSFSFSFSWYFCPMSNASGPPADHVALCLLCRLSRMTTWQDFSMQLLFSTLYWLILIEIYGAIYPWHTWAGERSGVELTLWTWSSYLLKILKQTTKAGEIGSSTMPHKVNLLILKTVKAVLVKPNEAHLISVRSCHFHIGR